ncbi:MAG TPA: hypothetical protein PKI52_14470 [Aggregatilineales bacterium]|nr:hypothetical protein [Aggregatilineales bacterium]
MPEQTRIRLPIPLKPTFTTVFIVIACVYMLFQPPEFNTTDGAVRDLTARNLYYHGDLALRQVEEGEYLNNLWTIGRDGRPYIYFGIGQSLMQLPFLAALDLAKKIGVAKYLSPSDALPTSAVMIISSSLIVAFAFGIVQKLGYSSRTALKTASLVAFGSILWGLSRQSYDMVQATMGVFGALYFIVSAQISSEQRWAKCFAAGLIYGVAIVTRASAITAGPALGLLVLGSPAWESHQNRIKAAMWCIAGGLAIVWIIPLYNYLRFEDIFVFGYTGHAPYPGAPILPGLARWLFSPWQGMFIYMPILFALPIVARRFRRKHSFLLAVLGLLFVSDLIFHAQYSGLGLYGWGPYYILNGILPLFIIFAEFFHKPQVFARWHRALIGALTALTILLQAPSLIVPTERYQSYLASQNITGSSDTLVWSLEWWPLRMQTEGALTAIRNLPDWQNYLDTPSSYDAPTLLRELFSYNLPDWWWLYRLLHGGELGLIVPLLAIFGLASLSFWTFHPAFRHEAVRESQRSRTYVAEI